MNPAQIVLIEDNPADVLLIEMALKENGILYTLTRFENGEDALRTLSSAPGSESFVPDAILLDLNTPRTNGFDTLQKFKAMPHLAEVPIAILTSSRDRRDRQRATIQGVRYIEKPSRLRDFLVAVSEAVKEMLAGGLPHDDDQSLRRCGH